MRLALKVVVNGVGVYVSALLAKPSIEFVGSGSELVWTVVWVALVFGLVNTFALPIIRSVRPTARRPIVALCTFSANVLLLLLISKGSEHLSARLQLQNFWPALIGGLIATTVSLVLHAALPETPRSAVKELA
ncbi:phage holin family protein [Kribbella sp. NPDC049584]|uniref:phage holin family protein n=1 Tax=Kribbella sp. NPDC049584 TaxID=3154833 RepID=UPI003431B0C0